MCRSIVERTKNEKAQRELDKELAKKDRKQYEKELLGRWETLAAEITALENSRFAVLKKRKRKLVTSAVDAFRLGLAKLEIVLDGHLSDEPDDKAKTLGGRAPASAID